MQLSYQMTVVSRPNRAFRNTQGDLQVATQRSRHNFDTIITIYSKPLQQSFSEQTANASSEGWFHMFRCEYESIVPHSQTTFGVEVEDYKRFWAARELFASSNKVSFEI